MPPSPPSRTPQAALGPVPATAGLCCMVGRYTEALDAAAQLAAYPEAEFVRLVEFLSEGARVSSGSERNLCKILEGFW